MKKFSLKKITAAVSAAAMIATMGTSAFADTPIQAGEAGDGMVNITDVSVKQHTAANEKDLYDVTILYKSKETQGIGVTMLTYVDHGTDPLYSGTTSRKPYADGGTMRIVGVDQKTDVADIKVDDSDTEMVKGFKFTVTTNPSTAGGYYMKKGKAGIIMLSGDKVNKPAAAAITIYATAKATATVDVGTVNVAANLNEAGIKAALTTAAQAKSIDIMDADSKENKAKENVSLSDANFTWTQDASDATKYVGTATLTSVEGVIVPAGGIEVTANATVNKTAVQATGVAKFDSKSIDATADAFKTSIQKDSLTAGSEINDMQDLIAGKTAEVEVVSNEENTQRIATDVTIDKGWISTSPTYVEGTTNYEFTVIIPKTYAPTGGLITIPDKGLTFKVNVEVTAKPAITAIAPKTAFAGTYDYNVSETDTFTVDKIAAKLKEAITGDTTDVTYTVDSTSHDAKLADFDYNWNVTMSADGNTATAQLVVTGIKTADISNAYAITSSINVGTPVTVTKKETPAFVYGDPDGNGIIEIDDVIYAFEHMGEDVNASIGNQSVDVDVNNIIEIDDVIYIFDKMGIDPDKTGFPIK